MDITIIGAGPIGCYAGYLLAKSGHHQVNIYERKSKLGLPVQCTGILTSDLDQFSFPINSFLINTINAIGVYTNSKNLFVGQKDYIICREKFDNFFADLAQKAGVRIYLDHSFVRKEEKILIIRDNIHNIEKRIASDIVIAADGPLSPTAKAYGFYYKKRKNFYGIQARVEGVFDPDRIETYFSNEICPGLFAWIVPESSTTARVGLATIKDSKSYFDLFMRKHSFIAKEIQGGVIPIYNPKQKLKEDNCYLLGDAAGFVKATTLGGLLPGLEQAKILANCINKNKNYGKEVKPLKKKLWLHLQLHLILARFSDKDWNRLVNYVQNPKVKKILEKHTRENPFPLIVKLLLKEPRLVYFLKYLVKI